MPHDVFISHSSRDKPAADAICAALEAGRIRCWIAPRDVMPGRAFSGEIKRAIEQCRVMVLVFSSHSNSSEDVLREVQLAARSRCHIVNFRIEDVIVSDDLDYYLTVPHWLDALTPPMERHYGQLVESVKALIALDRPVGLANESDAQQVPAQAEKSIGAVATQTVPELVRSATASALAQTNSNSIQADRGATTFAARGSDASPAVPRYDLRSAAAKLWPASDRGRAWIMALSLGATGFVSCLAFGNILNNGSLFEGRNLGPGLGFGLSCAAWLWSRRWLTTLKAVMFVVASTGAYFAAYMTSFYLVVFCMKGVVPFGSIRLLLLEVGLLGGVVGSALLVGALAMFSPQYPRVNWRLFITIGTALGGFLFTGGGASLENVGHLSSFGDRVFITLWQCGVGLFVANDVFSGPRSNTALLSNAPKLRVRLVGAVWILVGLSAAHCLFGFVRSNRSKTETSVQAAALAKPESVTTSEMPDPGAKYTSLWMSAERAFNNSDWARAEEDYSAALAIRLGLPSMFIHRAQARLRLNQIKGAVDDLTKVIDAAATEVPWSVTKKELSVALNERGLSHAKLNENQLAIDDYSRAIELIADKTDPDLADIYENRARANFALGNSLNGLGDTMAAADLKQKTKR